MQRGDLLTETWNYNVRLQTQSITAGSVFGENIYYCANKALGCNTNNGNILTINLATQGVDQNYSYDTLNRITSMTEGGRTQSWDYDNRANRWWTANSGSPVFPLSSFLPANEVLADCSRYFATSLRSNSRGVIEELALADEGAGSDATTWAACVEIAKRQTSDIDGRMKSPKLLVNTPAVVKGVIRQDNIEIKIAVRTGERYMRTGR